MISLVVIIDMISTIVHVFAFNIIGLFGVAVMNKYIYLLFSSEFNDIPEFYKNEFQEKRLSINHFRERIYAIILIIWNALMLLYVGIGAFGETWIRVPAYKYEFYLHIAGLIFASLFMWQFLKRRKKGSTESAVFSCLLNLGFIAFILHWTAIMTIIDLLINQQLIVYSIGIMAVSISLIMSPKENFLIYISTYIVLVTGTVLTQDSHEIIESSILNGLMLVVLGMVISKMIFAFHVKDFMKSKTIQEKTKELEDSQQILEKALLKRTEELASANKQLVREINSRHAMEIQVLKADLEYQKNLMALNEAKEYDRLRGEFFANISHELRTPLNIIFSTMQMINVYLSKDNAEIDKNKMSKYMNLMRQNCYRLLRLINNIIDITKIDSGYLSIKLSNEDIVQIVENITMSVVPYAEHNGLIVVFDTETEQKVIACDPDKMERIILNLLSNAIKFTAPSGSISVSMHEMNDSVIIKVKDTGIGISEENQKLIFDRFIQVDKSTTREKEGSGIGLSLAKSLVELHKGRISVVSQPGKGSEFIIELPDVTVVYDKDNVEYISKGIVVNTEVINIEFSDIYPMVYDAKKLSS